MPTTEVGVPHGSPGGERSVRQPGWHDDVPSKPRSFASPAFAGYALVAFPTAAGAITRSRDVMDRIRAAAIVSRTTDAEEKVGASIRNQDAFGTFIVT